MFGSPKPPPQPPPPPVPPDLSATLSAQQQAAKANATLGGTYMTAGQQFAPRTAGTKKLLGG